MQSYIIHDNLTSNLTLQDPLIQPMIYPKVFSITPPEVVEGLGRIAKELNVIIQVKYELDMRIVRLSIVKIVACRYGHRKSCRFKKSLLV